MSKHDLRFWAAASTPAPLSSFCSRAAATPVPTVDLPRRGDRQHGRGCACRLLRRPRCRCRRKCRRRSSGATSPRTEIDRRSAAGEFPHFFRLAGPEDVPADLEWLDGMDLPDIGSPDAKKGGTLVPPHRGLSAHLAHGSGPMPTDPSARASSTTLPSATRRAPPEPHRDRAARTSATIRAWRASLGDRPAFPHRVRAPGPGGPLVSDGQPVTTDDVLFAFFYFWQSKHSSVPPGTTTSSIATTPTVARYDDHTFSMTVPEAKPDLASKVLELRPLPLTLLLARWARTTCSAISGVSCRPPARTWCGRRDVKKGRSVTLTRVDDWWADDLKFWRNRFNPERMHLVVIRDTAKRFESLQEGRAQHGRSSAARVLLRKVTGGRSAGRGWVHQSGRVLQPDSPPDLRALAEQRRAPV